ncbi:glucans biosynthesis glucosyltransferase MdoH [Paracoccaceae bacterium GXU_MW_L88]
MKIERDTPYAPVPPDAPLEMPTQDLSVVPDAGPAPEHRVTPAAERARIYLARLLTFGGAAAATVFGFTQMLAAFGDNVVPLQWALLFLFTPTFLWVSFSFFGMLAGVFARNFSVTRDETAPLPRLAVVMPIYHEDAAASLGALITLAEELAEHGRAEASEIFVLSDSRQPEAVIAERLAVQKARDLSPLPIWYRQREDNTDHKSGNVADFVRRWGGRYDQMVVLDADSIMSGGTIAALSDRMRADPAVGLIQTMPMLIGGETIFARVTQFAGRIYGPMIARGVSAWSGDNGNFWGHNAIINVKAFAACCGLPRLKGKPPFGGSILSHDFVEAALLRRAGWKVRLDHDLRGSYEGSPPTLIDVAKRERRWAQGNLQHLGLIRSRGFTAISRTHFIIGVFGFVMSPIWLAMILVGLALSFWVLLSTPEYFPSTYQMFPDWPVFDSRRMLWLFFSAMTLLLLPKFVATFRAWKRPLARNAGGRRRVLSSAVFETLLSALIAPVQMLIQTRQIAEILSGRDSGWGAQLRTGSMPSWSMVWGRHWTHVALGVVTLIVLSVFAPPQLIWLSPILAGLILSPVVSRYSASPLFGRWARLNGLLVTPEERDPPKTLTRAATLTRQFQAAEHLQLPDMARNPAALARYSAMLDTPDETRPAAKRLHEISAEAKIAHAQSRAEALSFLDRQETLALIGSANLMRTWSALPE